jgi:hypothetical protein
MTAGTADQVGTRAIARLVTALLVAVVVPAASVAPARHQVGGHGARDSQDLDRGPDCAPRCAPPPQIATAGLRTGQDPWRPAEGDQS